MLDQAVSSVSNVALTLAVAHTTTSREFGAYAALYVVYATGLQLSRAIGSEPLVRFVTAQRPPASSCRLFEEPLAASALLGVFVAALLLIGAYALRGPFLGPAVVFGATFPLLILQDAIRYAFFAQGAPAKAVVNDVAWLALQTIAFVILFSSQAPGPSFLAAWAVTGSLAAGIGSGQLGLVPSLSRLPLWVNRNRDIMYTLEFGAYRSAYQATMFAVGYVAGLATWGASRR